VKNLEIERRFNKFAAQTDVRVLTIHHQLALAAFHTTVFEVRQRILVACTAGSALVVTRSNSSHNLASDNPSLRSIGSVQDHKLVELTPEAKHDHQVLGLVD